MLGMNDEHAYESLDGECDWLESKDQDGNDAGDDAGTCLKNPWTKVDLLVLHKDDSTVLSHLSSVIRHYWVKFAWKLKKCVISAS